MKFSTNRFFISTKMFFLLGFVLLGVGIKAQTTTINFDVVGNWTQDPTPIALTSYGAHSYSQSGWSFTSSRTIRNGTTAQDGFAGALGTYSWRLENAATSGLTATCNLNTTISSFGFDVRRWDLDPDANYSIEYSSNSGTTWTNTGTTINNTYLSNSSNWRTFLFTFGTSITVSSGEFMVKVTRVGGERIMIDNFQWTIACAPAAEPTTQASGISATALCTSATINFTGGNGTNNLVIMSTSNDITDPADQTNYTANTVYGSGSTTGTNDYVVYKGTGSSVTVTGLTNNTTYYFKIVEYNGTSANCTENYLSTTTVNSITTGKATEPTTNASSVTITPGCYTAEINFTGGNGTNALIVMSTNCTISDPVDQTAYSANTVFGSGNTTGAGDFVVYNNSGSTVNVSNLNNNTSYCIKIYEYNGTATPNCLENYLTTGAVSATFTTLNTGCVSPHLTGVMINSCTGGSCSEGDTEIVYGNAGDFSFVANATNFQLSYNFEAPLVNHTNSLVTRPTITSALNTASGCAGTFVEGTGTTIPAGGRFMVVDQNFCPEAYDWTEFCGNGPIYVLYSSDADWNSTGNFGNDPGATSIRYFATTINCGTSGTFTLNYNYDAASLAPYADGDYVLFDKDGGAATAYGNNGCTVDPILLPVDITYFYGSCSEEEINIYWQTASESNNSHFTLLKTKDGKYFEEVTRIEGQGTKAFSTDYAVSLDKTNETYYYRLKQTDFDGKSTYSDFISVNCISKDLFVYPNPSKDIFFINGIDKNSDLDLFNELGQKLESLHTDKNSMVLNLSQKASGVYYLKVLVNNQVQTIRLILQK